MLTRDAERPLLPPIGGPRPGIFEQSHDCIPHPDAECRFGIQAFHRDQRAQPSDGPHGGVMFEEPVQQSGSARPPGLLRTSRIKADPDKGGTHPHLQREGERREHPRIVFGEIRVVRKNSERHVGDVSIKKADRPLILSSGDCRDSVLADEIL